MRLAIVLFVVLTAGCAMDRELPPQTDEVRIVPGPSVPVLVPCDMDQKIKDERPNFVFKTNEELAAIPDVEKGSRLYKAALAQYIFWVDKLEGAFEICRNSTHPESPAPSSAPSGG